MKEVRLLDQVCVEDHTVTTWNWYLEITKQLDQILVSGLELPFEESQHDFIHLLDSLVNLTIFEMLVVWDIRPVDLGGFYNLLVFRSPI